MTSWEVVWAFPSLSAILLNIVLKSFLIIAAIVLINHILKNSLAVYRYLSWKLGFLLLGLLLCSAFFPHISLVPIIEEAVAMDIVETLPLPYQTLETSSEEIPRSSLLSPNTLSISWTLLVQWIWLLGGLFYLFLFIKQWRSFQNEIKLESLAAPDEWEDRLNQLKAEMDVSSAVTIKLSKAHKIPFTFGWRHPFIFLPGHAITWDTARLETVFRHELGHIKQGDYLSKLLVQWIRIFYWWNPLVSWAIQQYELECEKSCDERVLLSGVDPTDYAQHLIAVARELKAPYKARKNLSIALSKGTDLKSRVVSILNFQLPIKIRNSRQIAYWVLSLMLPLLFLNFGFPFRYEQSKSTKQLIKELAGDDMLLSLQAAKSLGELKAKSAYPALVNILENEDPRLRALSAWALGQIDEDRATKDLVPLLYDRFDCVQEKAVLSLGEIGAASTFYEVIKAQNHPNPEIRKASLWSLYRIGCMPAFHHISQHTNDNDSEVSNLAEELLKNFEHTRLRQWFLQSQNNSAKNWVYAHFQGIQEKGRLEQLVKCLAKNQKEEKRLLQIIKEYQEVEVLDQIWQYLQ